jgi:hypothetical protein
MNAATIHINFAKAVPRTIWWRSDIIPVVIGAAFAFVAIFVSFIYIQPAVINIAQQDIIVKQSHTRLVPQTTQIQAELDAVNDIQKSRDTVLQARQSGLVIAQQIVSLGNSLENDGVASRINSRGELAGIARDFPALTRIWNRLGPNYAVTVADPTTDGTINFTIQAVTAIPTPPPVNAAAPGGTSLPNAALPSGAAQAPAPAGLMPR